MLDMFSTNAFDIVTLTNAINNTPFVPGRIGEMGLFRARSVPTTKIAIEQKDDQLILVPPSPRGGPGTTVDKLKRNVRDLIVPHFQINDAVLAEEVQNVRAFGSDSNLQTLMGFLGERFIGHQNSFAATEEYARIGAIKGVVTYADGSTLNLFDEFEVSQEAEIDFDLDAATPVAGVLRKKCADITRQISGLLGGVQLRGLHAFCGDAFFDDLIAHNEVRTSYLQTVEAQELRASYVKGGQSYGTFDFGGITWENYRGAVNGTNFIDTDKCHIFPVGVPDLFMTYWAPADYDETVNTMGRRLYVHQYPFANSKGRHLEVQMNALHICTRPRVLIQGKRT